MAIEVDLSSDTVTKPTPEMRRFMCEAEVGDEQKHEDPTVNLLQEMVAELLGKEAALFLPSGTMCNEIALRVHCRHGEEMLAHRSAHPIHFEAGGPAARAGVNGQSLDGPRGQYDAATLDAAIRPDNRYMPRSRLVWVEQTSNLGGGSIWPLEKIREVTDVARRRGLVSHMDGARLMNAVVATGVSAREWAAPFDSAWIDFTKGLGAPVGAAMAGSRDFIAEAWRLKQQMGGAMRQAGIISAGGIYALHHHVKRLAEDHGNARRLAEGLARLPGITLDPARVETNLVFFDLTGAIDAPTAVERLLARGIRMGALGPRTIRAVTHLDVTPAGIDKPLAVAREVFRGLAASRGSGSTTSRSACPGWPRRRPSSRASWAASPMPVAPRWAGASRWARTRTRAEDPSRSSSRSAHRAFSTAFLQSAVPASTTSPLRCRASTRSACAPKPPAMTSSGATTPTRNGRRPFCIRSRPSASWSSSPSLGLQTGSCLSSRLPRELPHHRRPRPSWVFACAASLASARSRSGPRCCTARWRRARGAASSFAGRARP